MDVLSSSLALGLFITAATSAGAQNYGYCQANGYEEDFYLTPAIEMPGDRADAAKQYEVFVKGRTSSRLMNVTCHQYESRAEAQDRFDYHAGNLRRGPYLLKIFDDFRVGSTPRLSEEKAKPKPAVSAEATASAVEKKPTAVPSTAPQAGAERRKEAEERFEKAKTEYEAKLAEQKRQVEEFERAQAEVARRKAEQQAAAQRALESFRAEQAAHAEKLRQHQLALDEHQRKLNAQQQGPTASAKKGRFQATSAIVHSREAAMAALMHQKLPGPLSDVQCAEVKMYTPPKWTCWGYYEADVGAGRGSAQ